MRQLARVHWERRCLECLRHLKVQSEPATGDRPLVQRLAHERVHEREAVDLLGILDDDPGRHRRLQRGDQLVELELARDDPQSGKPEIGPQHGRQGERFQRRRRQSIQTTADHLLDALRHARGRLRRLSQAAHQLLDKERVAAGLLAQPLRQRDVGSLLTDASGDQRRRLRRVKTGEADTVEKTIAAQVRQRASERTRRVRLHIPVRGEHEHRRSGSAAGQLAHQPNRRRISPMQILDDHQQPALARGVHEQLQHRLKKPLAVMRTVAEAADGRCGGPTELRDKPSQQLHRGLEARLISQPWPARRVVPKRLHERLIRRHAFLVGAPIQHETGLGVHLGGEPRRQARLADPRLTGEGHQAAVSAPRLRPKFAQPPQRRRPAHERPLLRAPQLARQRHRRPGHGPRSRARRSGTRLQTARSHGGRRLTTGAFIYARLGAHRRLVESALLRAALHRQHELYRAVSRRASTHRTVHSSGGGRLADIPSRKSATYRQTAGRMPPLSPGERGMRDMGRILGVVLLAAGLLIATGSAAARASSPSELSLPGPAFFPESITAAPNGALFVSSLVTGEIVRFAPGSSDADHLRRRRRQRRHRRSHGRPRPRCALGLRRRPRRRDSVGAARLRPADRGPGDQLPDARRRAVRGHRPRARRRVRDRHRSAAGSSGSPHPIAAGRDGHLEVWSADPQLAGGAFPVQINGIAFDGDRTLYTTNYSTGELFAVGIAPNGRADPAVPIALDTPMTNPDGIRWHEGYLYIAENANGLSRVDPRTGTRTLIDRSLDQPTSLVIVGCEIWITEGQVLRLQSPSQSRTCPSRWSGAASTLYSPLVAVPGPAGREVQRPAARVSGETAGDAAAGGGAACGRRGRSWRVVRAAAVQRSRLWASAASTVQAPLAR